MINNESRVYPSIPVFINKSIINANPSLSVRLETLICTAQCRSQNDAPPRISNQHQ